MLNYSKSLIQNGPIVNFVVKNRDSHEIIIIKV